MKWTPELTQAFVADWNRGAPLRVLASRYGLTRASAIQRATLCRRDGYELTRRDLIGRAQLTRETNTALREAAAILAGHFGCKVEDVYGFDRIADGRIDARKALAVYARDYLGMTWKCIAMHLRGDLHHPTAIYWHRSATAQHLAAAAMVFTTKESA